MTVAIYHNPRCSKSRQTLAPLRERGLTPRIINYLEDPPGEKELRDILALLGMEPRELMRKQESAYREHGLDAPDLSAAQLAAAMVAHPILIERPIVLANGKAALGRPPDKVLEIL